MSGKWARSTAEKIEHAFEKYGRRIRANTVKVGEVLYFDSEDAGLLSITVLKILRSKYHIITGVEFEVIKHGKVGRVIIDTRERAIWRSLLRNNPLDDKNGI